MLVARPAAKGCVALLVGQLHGKGDVVVPENLSAASLDAFRVAAFWARVQERGEGWLVYPLLGLVASF